MPSAGVLNIGRQSEASLRAVRFHRTGGPEVLQYEDVQDPVLQNGEVLVKVRACSVNRIDVWFRTGRYRSNLPRVLGADVSGEVAAVKGCGDIAVGDRVVLYSVLSDNKCSFCLAGQRNRCINIGFIGGAIDGGYAEYVKVPCYNIMKINRLDYATAAALPVAFGTAWNALASTFRVGPEDTVLVWGGGSGLGHAAVQVARLLGSRVIATAGDESKLEMLREIGASDAINHNTEDVVRRVGEITSGAGVSVVFDHIGGDTWAKSLGVLSKGGRLISLGVTTGESTGVDIGRLYRNELRIVGVYAYTKEDLNSVLRLAEEGRLKPYIHSEMPLGQASEAHRLLESRRLFGKILLVP